LACEYWCSFPLLRKNTTNQIGASLESKAGLKLNQKSEMNLKLAQVGEADAADPV
jgi:hypothetical protein